MTLKTRRFSKPYCEDSGGIQKSYFEDFERICSKSNAKLEFSKYDFEDSEVCKPILYRVWKLQTHTEKAFKEKPSNYDCGESRFFEVRLWSFQTPKVLLWRLESAKYYFEDIRADWNVSWLDCELVGALVGWSVSWLECWLVGARLCERARGGWQQS